MRSLLAIFLFCSPLFAHPLPDRPKVASAMAQAANAVLESLTPDQRSLASFPFASEERETWYYVPRGDRKGVSLRDLSDGQEKLVFALLRTGLSSEGIKTARQIIALEQYLAEKEGNPVLRDPEKYYLSLFGTPAPEATWGWRFEGHHLSLNYTIIDGKKVVFTPTFFGTNPAEILEGDLAGQRPLGRVEDQARAFAQRVVKTHPSIHFTKDPPKEILSRQDRTASALQPIGLSGSELNEADQQALQKVIDAIADHLASDLVGAHLLPAKSVAFAWGGSLARGEPHYFRMQSPGVLIEYANTQNKANHAHLVIRFTENDFGRDLLKEHLEHSH